MGKSRLVNGAGGKISDTTLAYQDFISLPCGTSPGVAVRETSSMLAVDVCKYDIENGCRRDERLSGLMWTCWDWCACCASTTPGRPWTAWYTSCPGIRARVGTLRSSPRRAPESSWARRWTSTKTAGSWRRKRSEGHRKGAPWWPAALAAVALQVRLAHGLSI